MNLIFKWVPQLADLSMEAWNELAAPIVNPFMDWEWLQNLEQTGCVHEDTGWLPCHLTVWREQSLIAAAPMYIKTHSWGEFVFDQFWARAAMAFQLPYYPKLVGMSPFSPVAGYRFLIAPGEHKAAIQAAMLDVICTFCQRNQLGGFHLLHIDPEWRNEMAPLGLHAWQHYGLVWENRDFANFNDYLGQFRSHRRKTIRRERQKIQEQAISFSTLTGPEITESAIQNMYRFYTDTCAKYWGGSQYLHAETFLSMQKNFSHRMVLMQAHGPDSDMPMAMSLLLRKDDHLYGRYWGCQENVDGLHFETCYYQPIEWAISQGIRWYDAGSGGTQHKHRRGFPAQSKFSLHKLFNPAVDQIWRHHLPQINQETQEHLDQLNLT